MTSVFFDRMAQFKWILYFRRKKIEREVYICKYGLGVNKINVNLKVSINVPKTSKVNWHRISSTLGLETSYRIRLFGYCPVKFYDF